MEDEDKQKEVVEDQPVGKLKPEEVVNEEDFNDEPKAEEKEPPSDMPKKKKRKYFTWPPTKKQWAAYLIVLILILGGGYYYYHSKQKKDPYTIPVVTNKSDLVPSTLSGLPVAPSVNKIPVTGVMIENSTFARPQSGLSSASVVFEAIAEAGITRFIAIYQDTAPGSVGPIRSVRPYYEQWALGFDASIAHVGGSPEALSDISTWNVKDLNQFYNGSYYTRISSRQAPHNVYTSLSELHQLEVAKGYTTTNFSGFPRTPANPAKVPNPTTISMNISSGAYNVTYTYNKASNSYDRSEGGQPMIDANTNKQISPKVVIGMIIPYSLESDGYHSQYGVIGGGQAYVFQDGTLTIGTWSKSSNSSQIKFTQNNGQTLRLIPGQTWITALGSSSEISY
ncbi:MAG TPA: DUF3048 domain-containing protein [Candidatus Sulfotelmatobacter sp.]|nr:DUF3048 domain-containing protein [Candidatus Sulfotelmatobacter sp.]